MEFPNFFGKKCPSLHAFKRRLYDHTIFFSLLPNYKYLI